MLHIVTACSRPENLDKIYESIKKLSCEWTWHISFDGNCVFPPTKQIVVYNSRNGRSVTGNHQRNIVLDELVSIEDKKEHYVYFLDDDNLISKDIEEALKEGTNVLMNSMCKSTKRIFDAGVIRRGKIDTSSFLLTLEDALRYRWITGEKAADYFYIYSLLVVIKCPYVVRHDLWMNYNELR
jgi:hypothetical protein